MPGFFDKAKPLTPAQVNMIKAVAARRSEATMKKQLGVEHWAGDKQWLDAMIALESQPTINIEGLVAGYTGPGGKTVLPHRAVAKIDMRLVPDMTAAGTLALLKEHLAKKGFGDIEVNMSGGYDPNQTSPDTKLIQAQMATYKKLGQDPLLWPRAAGSWPGYIFTNRAAESSGGTLRPRSRHRRARSQRVLPDRLHQSEGVGTGWSCRIVCRVSVRAGVKAI